MRNARCFWRPCLPRCRAATPPRTRGLHMRHNAALSSLATRDQSGNDTARPRTRQCTAVAAAGPVRHKRSAAAASSPQPSAVLTRGAACTAPCREHGRCCGGCWAVLCRTRTFCLASLFAPQLSSSFTTGAWPAYEAQSSGVLPICAHPTQRARRQHPRVALTSTAPLQSAAPPWCEQAAHRVFALPVRAFVQRRAHRGQIAAIRRGKQPAFTHVWRGAPCGRAVPQVRRTAATACAPAPLQINSSDGLGAAIETLG